MIDVASTLLTYINVLVFAAPIKQIHDLFLDLCSLFNVTVSWRGLPLQSARFFLLAGAILGRVGDKVFGTSEPNDPAGTCMHY
jgi:hypothetical protein